MVICLAICNSKQTTARWLMAVGVLSLAVGDGSCGKPAVAQDGIDGIGSGGQQIRQQPGTVLSLAEQVALQVSQFKRANTLRQVTAAEWHEMLRKLDQYEHHRRVNGDRLPRESYYSVRALVEGACGQTENALRYAALHQQAAELGSLADALTGLANWLADLGEVRWKDAAVVIHRAAASMNETEAVPFLKRLRSLRQIAVTIQRIDVVKKLDAQMIERVESLSEEQRAVVFFELPSQAGDANKLQEIADLLLASPTLDRSSKLFVGARLLLEAKDRESETQVFAAVGNSIAMLDSLQELPLERRELFQRALATYQLFEGRHYFLQGESVAAIQALSSAASLFSASASARLATDKPLALAPDVWSTRLAEMRTRQHLATAYYSTGRRDLAEEQYQLLDVGLQLLRTALPGMQIDTEPLRSSLDLLEYEYRVNRAQHALSRNQTAIAATMLDQLSGLQNEAAASGIRLQDAKNQLSFCRILLNEMLQAQEANAATGANTETERENNFLVAKLQYAHRLADQHIVAAGQPVEVNQSRQLAMAQEIRGIAAYYLSGLLVGVPTTGLTPVEYLQQAKSDLEIAATFFAQDVDFKLRAVRSFIYVGQIYAALASRAGSDEERSQLQSLADHAIELATKNAGDDPFHQYNILMSQVASTIREANPATKYEAIESLLAQARTAAVRAVTRYRDRVLDLQELNVLSEAFDLTVDALLDPNQVFQNAEQDGNRTATLDKATLDLVLATMHQASSLAHSLDRPYTSRNVDSIGSPATVDDLVALQARNRLALVYYMTDSAGYVLVPQGNTLAVVRLGMGRREVEQWLAKSLPEITTRPAGAPVSFNKFAANTLALGEKLLPRELREMIDRESRQVLIIRSGAITQVPFEVFYGDQSAAVPQFSYATSTSTVRLSRASGAVPQFAIAVGANDDLTSNRPPILTAESEAEEIALLFGQHALLASRKQTEVAAILQAISARNESYLLHFATHGVLDSDLVLRQGTRRPTTESGLDQSDADAVGADRSIEPGGSPRLDNVQIPALVLPGSNGQVELLRTSDIARLSLGLCDIAVISSCDSARSSEVSRFNTGDSLANAFIDAGAKYVLATCWEIDDEAGSQFAKNFARKAFVENKPYAQSVQEARNELRQEARFSHPYFWAPYVLIESDLSRPD